MRQLLLILYIFLVAVTAFVAAVVARERFEDATSREGLLLIALAGMIMRNSVILVDQIDHDIAEAERAAPGLPRVGGEIVPVRDTRTSCPRALTNDAPASSSVCGARNSQLRTPSSTISARRINSSDGLTSLPPVSSAAA